MTQKWPWIDLSVVSVVGLMSSSPVAGTAVHFVPRWAIAGLLNCRERMGLSTVELSLGDLDPLGQRLIAGVSSVSFPCPSPLGQL